MRFCAECGAVFIQITIQFRINSIDLRLLACFSLKCTRFFPTYRLRNDNNIAITCFSPSIDLNYYTLIWMLFIETQLFQSLFISFPCMDSASDLGLWIMFNVLWLTSCINSVVSILQTLAKKKKHSRKERNGSRVYGWKKNKPFLAHCLLLSVFASKMDKFPFDRHEGSKTQHFETGAKERVNEQYAVKQLFWSHRAI